MGGAPTGGSALTGEEGTQASGGTNSGSPTSYAPLIPAGPGGAWDLDRKTTRAAFRPSGSTSHERAKNEGSFATCDRYLLKHVACVNTRRSLLAWPSVTVDHSPWLRTREGTREW
jgi:hypothetical protein